MNYFKKIRFLFFRFLFNQKKKIYIFAGGSSGSIFLHSLLVNHPNIFSIPVIIDSFRVAKNLKKRKISLINFLRQETKISYLLKKEKTERFGDFRKFILFDNSLFEKNIIELDSNYKSYDEKIINTIIHYAYYVALKKKKKFKYILQHNHNTFDFTHNEIKNSYEDAVFILTVRNPYNQFNSFFKYLKLNLKNEDELYKKTTQQLLILKKAFVSFIKNRSSYHIVNLEKLNSDPEKILKILCKSIGLKFDKAILESKFGQTEYSAVSIDKNIISGFQRNDTKLNLNDLDIAFINKFFQESFEIGNYSQIKNVKIISDDEIYKHDFLDIHTDNNDLIHDRVKTLKTFYEITP